MVIKVFKKVALITLVGVGILYFTHPIFIGKKHLQQLGLEATAQDFISAEILLGKSFIKPSEDPNKQLLQSGANPVEVTFSEMQFSAHISAMHPVGEVTSVFTQNNFEVSGIFERSRISGFKKTLGITSLKSIPLFFIAEKFLLTDPSFYFKGQGSVYDNKVSILIKEARIGMVPISNKMASNLLEDYFELVLEKAPAFNANEITLQKDFLLFYGTATAVVPIY
jgi:hypothetical protein